MASAETRDDQAAACICSKALICINFVINPPSVKMKALTHFVRYASTRHRQSAVPLINHHLVSPEPDHHHQHPLGPPKFVTQLKTPQLLSYALLNLVTSSPILLNTAIKLMPYTPNYLIKKIVYPTYCGGENYAEVRENARRLLDRRIGNQMLSYSVEDADGSRGDIFDDVVKVICESIDEVLVKHRETTEALYAKNVVKVAPAAGFIALKPTGLMKGTADILANYNNPAYADKWQAYLAKCREICQYALDHGKGHVVIVFDAEKKWLQDGVYAAQREMMKEFNRDGKVVVCGTIQMYLKEGLPLVKNEIALAKKDNYTVAMKLVRGAYLHSEPKRDEIIHATQKDTDNSYNAGCNLMLDEIIQSWKSGKPGPVSKLIVASHNSESLSKVDERITREAPLGFDFDKDESVVFGQLMGMNENQSSELAAKGRKVIKYVPWGPVSETRDYLLRRLEENTDAARGGWTEFKAAVKELFLRIFGRHLH